MDAQSIELPFRMKPQDLIQVEFLWEYQPAQAKAPTESIRISGATGVNLLRSDPGKAKPESLHAKQDPQALIALLKLFEDYGFLQEEDADPDPDQANQFLSLKIPGQSNRVLVAGEAADFLNRLAGAVRMTAALSVPDAAGKAFLKGF